MDDQTTTEPPLNKIRSQLEGLVAEINSVLAKDLPSFPGREAKKHFLEGGDHATTMSDADLASFKEQIDAVVSEAVPSALVLLQDKDRWMNTDFDATDGPRKDLDANTNVSEVLASVGQAIEAVFAASPLGPVDGGVHYRTPTWFIGGVYLPGRIEKYWITLAQYAAALEEEQIQDAKQKVRSLAQRWEDA